MFTPEGATVLHDFIQTTWVATRGWLLQRADERGGGRAGWGRLREEPEGRSCGEVGGAGAEVVFSLPFSFIHQYLPFVIPFVVFFFSFLFPSYICPHNFELLPVETREHSSEGAMRTKTRRQKRRTSQHRKRRNRGDEDAIRAWSSKNVHKLRHSLQAACANEL